MITDLSPGSQTSRVVVAGGSGFIGQALGAALSESYHLIGLSRSERGPGGGYREYRKVDLFALRDSEAGLKGADIAIYLVHSMMPAARLVQGHFKDLDILCADNFARAAALAGVKHIVYVGGLLPESSKLSEHLKSRVEVEEALSSTGIPVTTLRAGMVVGPGGSSYQLLARLVRRLPVMACPSWTRTRMQPVALKDLLQAVHDVLRESPEESRVFDIGAPEVLTYQDLMAATASSLGLKRRFLPVPFLSPGLSRLWVSLTTGAPKALVAPLIESLRHEMIAREDAQFRLKNRAQTSVQEMLIDAAKEQGNEDHTPRAFKGTKGAKGESKVCSVQRMMLPEGRNAEWAAKSYFEWLPRAMKGFIKVEESAVESEIQFVFRPTGHKLLGLRRLEHRCSKDRQVLRVTSGLLARDTERGRLEFRQVLDTRTLIASIHEFVPRLPWWIYRPTQGLFHRWVMGRFGRFLSRQESVERRSVPDVQMHE